MLTNLTKDIDNIVWWIPFKKLRNSIRNILYYNLNYKLNNICNNIESNNNELKPLLTSNEMNEFVNVVQNAALYLEFGSGGSTYYVLKNTKSIVISVESDLNWINYLRKNSFISDMEEFNRLKFYYVNIGNIYNAGRPIKYSSTYNTQYKDYSSEVFNIFSEYKNLIDIIFIDGRFRVACVLNTILHCSKNKNLIIMIHDFFDREYYHVVLKFLECVKEAGRLGVFKIKDDINLHEVKTLLKKYYYDFR